jgi:broad specificity phosphatase PhoE
VAQRLAVLPIKAVYSSPLTRCVETATYIADTHRLSVQHVEEVGEVEYGEWEGKKISKLAKKPLWHAVQFYPSRARFPGGEALRDVQFRAVQALEETAARHDKEMVVVVSHADVIRLLLAHYLGVHIDLFQRWSSLRHRPASWRSARAAWCACCGSTTTARCTPRRLPDDGPKETKRKTQKKATGIRRTTG